jgi:hypothetical protein
MFKHTARNLTLALTLITLASPAIHAQSVTGGDPEPTSPNGNAVTTPNMIQMVLIALHLA